MAKKNIKKPLIPKDWKRKNKFKEGTEIRVDKPLEEDKPKDTTRKRAFK